MILIADEQQRPVLIIDDEPAIAEVYYPDESIVEDELKALASSPTLTLTSGVEADGSFFTTSYSAPFGSTEWILALMEGVKMLGGYTWEDA